jgi:RNA polymerase sigma factor (sigma-70 family)
MPNAQSRQSDILHEQGAPDGVLVEYVLAGDQSAFDLLVRRYRRLLASYIQAYLNDREQVFDVLQHVFLQLYTFLPTLSTKVPLKAWLFQVARNRCLDELRRRGRHAEITFTALESKHEEQEASEIEAITDPEPLPEEMAERNELHCSLLQAIFSLPPLYRSIVLLRSFKQLSFSEVGHILNMPESTVKTYFYRSLPRLRRELTGSVHAASFS